MSIHDALTFLGENTGGTRGVVRPISGNGYVKFWGGV